MNSTSGPILAYCTFLKKKKKKKIIIQSKWAKSDTHTHTHTHTHTQTTVNYHVITWGGSIRRLLVVKSHRSLLFTVLHHGAYANEFQMVFRYWWICLHSTLKTAWIKEKPKQRGETLNKSHSLKILWSSWPTHTDEYEKALRKAKKNHIVHCFKGVVGRK